MCPILRLFCHRIELIMRDFFRRKGVYLREMFPVQIYLPYILVLYSCLYFASELLAGKPLLADAYYLLGCVSAFFFMLLMRTFDDLKDFDLDRKIFPWRATARGDVLRSDIRFLSLLSFSVLLAVNLLFGQKTIFVFLGVMIYLLLTFKWFFAEDFHRRHQVFTMFTHQPIPWAINYFLIHVALASGDDYAPFSSLHGYLLAVFSLPITAWDVSRKIRAKGNETEYETFSMIFGTRPAAFLAFALLFLSGALAFYLGRQLDFPSGFFVIDLALLLGMTFFYFRFMWKPTIEHNILKNVTMLFTTLLFLDFLAYILLSEKVVWAF